MTNELTPEDADAVVQSLLSTIEKWINISMFGRLYLRVKDIGIIMPSVERAGSTPDTYCKIANASLKIGIATDLRKDKNSNMVLSFRKKISDDRPPSKEICIARWHIIKDLPFEEIQRLNFGENEIDNLGQKDAEMVIKEFEK